MIRIEGYEHFIPFPDVHHRRDSGREQGFADPDLPFVGLTNEDERFHLPLEHVPFPGLAGGSQPHELGPHAQHGFPAGLQVLAVQAHDMTDPGFDDSVRILEALDRARDEVGAADKVRHETVIRVKINLFGIAHLHDSAGTHHRDTIGKGQRLDPVVGHVDRCDLQLGQKITEFLSGLLPELCIEVAQGLVKENDLGLGHQRPRQGDTLLLPSAQFGRGAFFKALQLNEFEHFLNTLPDLILCGVLVLKGKSHVVEHVHVWPDGVGLEDHAQAPLFRRNEYTLLLRPDDLVPDDDLTRVGRLQPHYTPEQGGFPAAARTQQGEDVVGGDGEIHIIQSSDPFALGIVVLCQAYDLYFHMSST